MNNQSSYQENILKRYRETFPNKTLKITSEETGIQMTRIFRLYNGAEMKVKEYEAFERVINQASLSDSQFHLLKKFKACLAALDDCDLALLETEITHLLKIDRFVNKPFIEHAANGAMGLA